ncbi:MAG: methyltransferase domain-containing protein [Verrucomicrobia bacterium]|nr:methyltransferase domain-containing protein [Verrucomicrobiota bacterium]
MMPAAHEIHARLKSFYNRETAYYEEASATNRQLSPERARLFGWIHPEDRVLDVGCGTCENGVHLKGRARYFGADISFVGLHMATAALPPGTCRLAQAESQQLPFASNSFDVVLSTYALEHFVFPLHSLDEMWRVCRPGGRVLLISPAYDHPWFLPPSTSHWTRAERGWLILGQTARQFLRHFRPRHFDFARVSRPRVLFETYRSDFDAVHLVSAREVGNFFRAKGAVFLFENKRAPRPAGAPARPGRNPLREWLRDIALRAGWGEHAGLNLQLVVAKPGAE